MSWSMPKRNDNCRQQSRRGRLAFVWLPGFCKVKLWAFGAEVPAQENRIGKKKQVDTALRSFYRLPWLRGYYHLQFAVDIDKLLVEL